MTAPALTSEMRRVSDLAASERARLVALMRRHFLDVDDERFQADLEDKQWVLLFRDGEGYVQGFSTLSKYITDAGDGPVTIIFSGDTVVDQGFWGERALPRGWIQAVRWLHAVGDPPGLYWLLLTSGFRTYRFLPVFWQRFHPRPDGEEPRLRAMRDKLARERFGADFDAVSGVVRLPGHYRLRPELAEVATGRCADPHIDFFLRANPGHTEGDELVCLAPLDDSNLTRAGQRMIRP